MRNIKFRGKSKCNGVWLYGDVVRNVEGAVAIVPPYEINTHNECRPYEVDTETICEFTGQMLDGIEIYEHDLIECGKVLYEVVYDSYKCAFVLLSVLSQSYVTNPLGAVLNTFPCVHKGNIFDDIDKVKLK